MSETGSRARGRSITDVTSRHERYAKKNAMLWTVVRTAAKIADESSVYSRGLYEISPSLMLRLRELIDRVRPELKRMEQERMEEDHDVR